MTGLQEGTAFAIYDPCADNTMDGPIYGKNTAASHFMYTDAALIITDYSDIPLMHSSQVENPKYFLSLSRAVHAMKHLVKMDRQLPDGVWMFQLGGVNEVLAERGVEFIIGEGTLDFECPHYFQITHKAFVSISGKVYQYQNNIPVFLGEMDEVGGFEPNFENDIGINVFSII